MKIENITLIGAGNLATHIGRALKNAGHNIEKVYSRTHESAKKLANDLESAAITDLNHIPTDSGVIIFAIPESALETMVTLLKFNDSQLVIHTSGSVNNDIFKGTASNYGVLYPMQTFSKFRKINFMEVPVFVEGNCKESLKRVLDLANTISATVNITDTLQRQVLHISAVFINNFVNHFYTLGNQIASDNGCRFGFDIFKPIILETALKALESGKPYQCQTGPAIRGSKSVMDLHSQLLKKNPDVQKLYNFVSENIGKYYKTGM